MDIVVCKCVAVGDESTGKTSLLMVHATGEFPKEHLATVFENYDNVIKGTDRTIRLTLWDTSGQEDYDQLRPISYPDTHFFLIVFAIDNPRSLENVIAKWEREVTLAIDQGQAPIAKIILVGTKSDTRNEKGVETIPKSSIEAVVEQIGAIKYFEVSSLQNSGIQELFDYIIEHVRVSKTFARKMGLFESGSSDLDDDVTFGNAKKK